MKTNRIIARSAIAVLGVSALTMIGCSSNGGAGRHAGDIGMIRSNPSPSMHTLARRNTDRDNDATVSMDTDLRMIYDDIDRHILFTNRPSHLTRFPSRH